MITDVKKKRFAKTNSGTVRSDLEVRYLSSHNCSKFLTSYMNPCISLCYQGDSLVITYWHTQHMHALK